MGPGNAARVAASAGRAAPVAVVLAAVVLAAVVLAAVVDLP
jgi:hypothetical protein